MPQGTLDVMKLDGRPPTCQIMFEQNAGGTFVARVEQGDLIRFLHEEMRVDLHIAEATSRVVQVEGRTRMPKMFLEENNLHAAMEYLEEEG